MTKEAYPNEQLIRVTLVSVWRIWHWTEYKFQFKQLFFWIMICFWVLLLKNGKLVIVNHRTGKCKNFKFNQKNIFCMEPRTFSASNFTVIDCTQTPRSHVMTEQEENMYLSHGWLACWAEKLRISVIFIFAQLRDLSKYFPGISPTC